MDKLDLVLIPLLYLFRMTLRLISVAMNFMPTPSKVWTAIRNAITWTAISSPRLILFLFSSLHRLTQIPIIQIQLNMMEQSFIVRACLFWPKILLMSLQTKQEHTNNTGNNYFPGPARRPQSQ